MRLAPSLALAALLTATAAILSGCVLQEPAVVPPPEQSTEPIFASDEEALAAATDAYEAYLKMSDLIAQEGGKNPERIAPYVTEEWLLEEIHWNKELEDSGRKLVGNFLVDTTALQQMYTADSRATVVVIYACLDPTRVRMFDRSGIDVTPPELASPWRQEITLESRDNSVLRLAGAEAWSADSSC